MKIQKIAAVLVLVFSSFAASNVAPSKAELEAMYSKAFREFDASNFSEALKQLDEIDARQPDVAESHNLRGVILMRQGKYDEADAALQEAVRIDPKFWNARFNLAEIPFLKKNWVEARDRFEKLLSSNVSDLEGEAAQLIQYKILLTYLLEGKENMVDSILAKFELSPDTPAVHYSNAAIAFQHQKSKEAKDLMATAEKKFSPQLNKLFAESIYEVGWIPKPAGEARASIPLTTAAEREEKTKSFARSRLEQAWQALQQRDLEKAQKFVDEADAAEPNQPATLNLGGEILMEKKQFDEAETAFKKALKIDPKFRASQYNLAQIPFKKKDYETARDRFETLLKQTPGGDKNQASQMLKFKLFMTYLLEGKDSRAQKLMEQFQFTGDTPALYYAQAAWEFKHNNSDKANDWVGSAKRIYSSALNNVFADSFYDLGWLQSPAVATGPASAVEAATVMAGQTEAGPAIEPSPIPGTALASTKQLKAAEPKTGPKSETVAGSSPAAASSPATSSASTVVAGTPAAPEQVPAIAAPTLSPTVETTPLMAQASPGASIAALASPNSAAEHPVVAQSSPAIAHSSVAPVASTPATALAPAHVETARVAASRMTALRTLVIGSLLVAAMCLIAWVVVQQLRQRAPQVSLFRQPAAADGPSVPSLTLAASAKAPAVAKNLNGGPRQVSLQLKASEPSLRPAVVASGKPVRVPNGAEAAILGAPVEPAIRRAPELAPIAYKAPEPQVKRFEIIDEPSVGPVIEEPVVESVGLVVEEPVVESVGPVVEEPVVESFGPVIEEPVVESVASVIEEPVVESVGHVAEQELEPVSPTTPEIPEPTSWPSEVAASTAFASSPAIEAIHEPELLPVESAVAAPIPEPIVEPEPAAPTEVEPIIQGQPIPYQTPVWPDISAIERVVDTPSFDASIISTEASEPLEQQEQQEHQTTKRVIMPVTMPESIQIPTVRPTSAPTVAMPEPILIPTVRPTSAPTAAAPQPAGAMHTAVQLTFVFEIASMQLTPSFKMGALQVRPTSKIVTMRLAPSQSPQPGMNLQVAFEISKIQPTGGALGSIRLTPSQQQRQTPTGSPSFTVAGLQLVPNFEAAPVQLTPLGGGSASVLVTAPFQISTVEFSPSFEIASIALNSNSKQVMVQLPGPTPGDGAPMFEIANLQLTGSGDIGMMQLNLLGPGGRHA